MYSIINFMIKRNSIKFIVKENCIQGLSSFFQNVFNIMFICFLGMLIDLLRLHFYNLLSLKVLKECWKIFIHYHL